MKDTHTRASVAQLFRALPCQGRGRELESLRSHHQNRFLHFSAMLTLGPCGARVRVSSLAPSKSYPKKRPHGAYFYRFSQKSVFLI